MTESDLTALTLVCSLKPSPAPSSSELIAEHLQNELDRYGVTGETVRCVDHDIKPGVEKDMGGGDQWPEIREKVLAADILIFSTPTWMGHTSSVGQRVLERLDAELAETDDEGRPILLGKVALVAVVGNEDGAHHIVAEAFQALNDVGYSIPAQGCTYWNGAAMEKTDYNDLDEVPEATASATAAAARNAAHLARLLKASRVPAVSVLTRRLRQPGWELTFGRPAAGEHVVAPLASAQERHRMNSTSTESLPADDARANAPGQLTGAVVIVALVSAVSGMLYGYDTGIISGALLQITKDFGIAEAWKQVIAASILLGAVIGALVCSYLSEKRGRKGTLVMLAVVFVVGALWCAFSPNPVALSVGRLILGFAVGGATQTAPMYVAELAPPKYRGRLVLCFQIAIGVGIVIATIVGASESIPWRWSIGAAAVPAAIMLGLLLRLPESPRWLIKDDDRDKARGVLERVRPSGYDVDGELDEMAELTRKEKTAKTRGWSGLREAWVRPALVLGCGIAIFTQLSGIEMIIYYSPTILTDNGFSESVALEVSVALGVSYLVAQLVGLSIIDKVGRRRLTLIMIPGAALSLFVLGTLFVTGNSGRDSVPFIIACLVVFMLFNAGGLQLMGWLTGSETYPLAVRPAGTAAQSAALWGTNLLITLTLLTLISGIGVGPAMWLYGLFNVAAWLFVYFKMPDLTGRSLEEIEGKLSDGKFSPADFAR